MKNSIALQKYLPQNNIFENRFQNDLPELDSAISAQELKASAKSLKNNKACYSDLIKNEMIKASCGPLINVYLKLFNSYFVQEFSQAYGVRD